MPESLEARAERQRLQLLEMRALVSSLQKRLQEAKDEHGSTHNTIADLETKCDKLMTKVSALRQERRALKDALASEPCRAQKREREGGELERHVLKLARNDGVFRRLCLAIHPDKLTGNDAKAGAIVMQLLSVAR